MKLKNVVSLPSVVVGLFLIFGMGEGMNFVSTLQKCSGHSIFFNLNFKNHETAF
jgi:ABC-type molybdate transport system permease subunit